MKVLQLANGYYKTRIYENLFAAQEAFEIENEIFVPINRNETLTPSEKPNVYTVKCFHTLDRFLFYSKQAKMQKYIEEKVDLRSIQIIHAHTVFSGGYTAYQYYRKYGIPYIVAVRNTDVNTFFKRMPHLRKTGVEILRNAERIVFLSEVYRRYLLEKYIPRAYHDELLEKSMVIPNGIADIFLSNKGEPKTLKKDELRLIFVGDLFVWKNPELLVGAAEMMRRDGKNVSLKMIGQIKDEKYRTMLSEKPWVEHHDRCPQSEVIGYLRESDILVVPSHRETFGLVYAEAMSQGLPVLYTKGQGFDGQLPEGEVGFPISDRDPKDIVEKINRVKENYAQLSRNCIKDCGRFNWKDIAETYFHVYQEML